MVYDVVALDLFEKKPAMLGADNDVATTMVRSAAKTLMLPT